HRIVAVDRRFKTEQAKAVEAEDHLDQQGSGEKDADKGAREARDNDQHGVPEHMSVEDAPLAQSFGARGQNILLADLVEEGVLGKLRQRREPADDKRRDRQGEMPEIIEDLADQAELLPVVRRET